jgi:hypothetical protein
MWGAATQPVRQRTDRKSRLGDPASRPSLEARLLGWHGDNRSALMTFEQHVASLEQRIARAERARDRWRVLLDQERYLQACSKVSALGVQLELLRERQECAAHRLPGPGVDS